MTGEMNFPSGEQAPPDTGKMLGDRVGRANEPPVMTGLMTPTLPA
jgi:hypothetical protein